MFRLEISTTNAAFFDDPTNEVARILTEVADRAKETGLSGDRTAPIRDSNGATVGAWSYTPEGDDWS